MRRGVNPAWPRPSASAIEKQPACAGAISSSGLVPFSFSNRVLNEYRPSKAPLPSFMVPDPSVSEPSQSASALRSTIGSLHFNLVSAHHVPPRGGDLFLPGRLLDQPAPPSDNVASR